NDTRTILMPYGDVMGLNRGDRVRCVARMQMVPVGRSMLGRVVDGRIRPIDGKGHLATEERRPILADAPHPLERRRITEPIATGVKVVDALATCGKGQRMGIFSGAGVGKSTLLGMIARYTAADVNVISLVGERGREVNEFLQRDLGDEGLKRSVVVVATGEQPPLIRVKAAFASAAIAEFFRDQGLDVMWLMDSVTRMAMAQREIGLASGEPPATKGFTPSVFAMLPRLLERAGQSSRGSITGFFAVLVDADDMNEPISDAVRSILDGHLWLARRLAERGQYPAVDPLGSISRVMNDVVDREHREAALRIKSLLAAHLEVEDLINIGAYVKGTNPEVDTACRMMGEIREFMAQPIATSSDLASTREMLLALNAKSRETPAPVGGEPTSVPGRTPRIAVHNITPGRILR
ncbi:MAG TPA: FliI/YscN family ATPase, partial [Planctomycetota bacterium]|nr:FliI/YscN family ATPase [Planctomycetota bacterium]